MPKLQKKPVTTPSDITPKTAKKDNATKTTKAEQVIKLLQRKNGASIDDLQKATGWQAHSVHGFLSSTVRKRMGLPLKSEVTGKGERRYLIAGA